jgi:hypothetical protein
MRGWAWRGVAAVALGGAACAGAPPDPEAVEARQGDLAARHGQLEAAAPATPVMRITREGDVYRVTDLLLDKTFEWRVPFDDPEPRWLRFQLTEFSCQAGLLRHGAATVDLQNGEAAVLRKDGSLAKAP